jgi:O-antigen/teichoic acid export membrane protein
VHESVRHRFLAGAFWSMAGSAAARATILLSTVAAGRLLGAHAFGELGIIQSTVALFGTLAGAGLGLTATKHVAEFRLTDRDRAGRYIGLVILTTAVAGSVMALLLAASASLFAPRILGSAELVGPVRIASGLVFFGAVIGAQTGAILGLEEYRAHAIVTGIRGLGGAILSVIGMWFWGLSGGVVGLVAGEAVAAMAAHVYLRRASVVHDVSITFQRLHGEIPALWTFSAPALVGSIVIMPALLGANLLLAHTANGYVKLGLFTAALKWNALVLFVPAALSLPQLPLLANLHGLGRTEQFRKALRTYVAVSTGVMIVPMLLLILFAGWVMALSGEQFRAGAPVLVVMAAAAIPMGMNTIIGQAVVSANGIWLRMAADVGLAVSLAVGAALLVPRYGEMGLAYAYFIAFTVATAALVILVRLRGSPASAGTQGPEMSMTPVNF